MSRLEKDTLQVSSRRRRSSVQCALFLFVTILTLFTCDFASAQQRFWITFRDRGPQVDRSSADPRSLGITERALWRRSKVLPAQRLIDELDLPVNPSYLRQLNATGVVIRSTSRWFNAVSAELTGGQRAALEILPCVASVEPVRVFFRQEPEPVSPLVPQTLQKLSGSAAIDYGASLTQLSTINVVDVHASGVTGSGVIIGVLDNGFNQHAIHPALKDIKVMAEYDFVQRDSNTSRAPGEYASQGNHGAGTLSLIGGYENGKLIGAAFGASFILGKTEVDSVEKPVEEDLYVEGLEWAERLGADVVSTSLGYNDWYTYSDFDGATATTTKAARIAARKGVLLVTAMGNEGNYRDARTRATGSLIAPADADSIVSVGAVSSSRFLAGFSSTGPTADGRIKPEVVAQGVSDYVMYGEAGYTLGAGTSFATPLVAGVAALILSAHPTLTPMQVRDRLILTARALYDSSVGMVSHPNNFYGWGMVDAARAVGISNPVPSSGQFVLRQNYPNPFNGSTTILVDAPSDAVIELSIYNILGQRVRKLYSGKAQVGTNYFQWANARDDAGNPVAAGLYLCRLSAPGSVSSQKILYIK
jgi:serine protease AprX